VVVALTANLLVALAKSGAALITGSVAVLAEAAHSWADTGNEVFLLVAHRRSRRPPDPTHPLGHGREAYVWSLVRCARPVRRRCCGGSDPFGAIRADTAGLTGAEADFTSLNAAQGRAGPMLAAAVSTMSPRRPERPSLGMVRALSWVCRCPSSTPKASPGPQQTLRLEVSG